MLAKRDHGKSARFGVRHTLRKGRRNGFVQRSVCKVGQSTRNAVQIPCAGQIRYRRDKGTGVAPPPERLPCARSTFASSLSKRISPLDSSGLKQASYLRTPFDPPPQKP